MKFKYSDSAPVIAAAKIVHRYRLSCSDVGDNPMDWHH